MVIKINYTSSDVYVSTSVSPVYVVVNYSAVNNGSAVAWGAITGTLSNQTDLQNALNAKFDDPTGTTSQYLRGDGSLATFPSLTGYVPYTGASQAVNLGAYDLTVNSLTIGKGNNALVNNTALGHSALLTITTGNFNTAVGYESLRNTTTGQYNTAVGQSSLFSNTTGSQNTAIGLNALVYNTTGGSNVVVGLDALQHNTTGSSNTAIGYNAGTHITGGSVTNTTASNSVFIGRDSKAGADGQTNQIVIGQNAVGNGSNTATIGNSSTTANYFTGSINGGSFVKSGGTSSQFLKADGSVDSSTYVGGSGATGQVAFWNGTSSQTGSNNLFWDAANSRLGIGTNAPAVQFDIRTSANAGTEQIRITNSSSGNLSTAGLAIQSNVAFGALIATSSTYNPLPFLGANAVGFYSTHKFVVAVVSGDFAIGTGASLTERFRLFGSTGNLLLQNGGTFTDGGQRLQVMGDAFIRGSGNGTSTTALTVQNSDGNFILSARNDRKIWIFSNNNITGLTVGDTIGSSLGTNISAFEIRFNPSGYIYHSATSGASSDLGGVIIKSNNTLNPTVNNPKDLAVGSTFAPTSGTGTYVAEMINPVINQTGGANGITRGLYVNPTLTAAADWRSIEWSNNSGWGLYGAGTAPNFLGGNLTVGRNHNGTTGFTIENTTNGSSSVSLLTLFLGGANSGFLGKYSSTHSGYKFVSSNDLFLSTATGDIALQNDSVSGKIKFGGGSSSTAQMTLTAAGRLLLGTTSESTFLLDVNGTARVSGATTLSGAVAINSTNVSTGFPLFVNGFIGATGLTLTDELTVGENFAIKNNGSQTIDIDANNNSTNAVFRVTCNGTNNELFRVNESGNFMLGTLTDAGFKLDVNGTARVSGNTQIGSTSLWETYINSRTSLSGILLRANYGVANVMDLTFDVNGFLNMTGVVGFTAPVLYAATRVQTGGNVQLDGNNKGVYWVNVTDQYIMGMSGQNLVVRANTGSVNSGGALVSTSFVSGNISFGGSTDAASAQLQIDSTTKGFLPPRMTNAQRTSISSPAVGLIVYCTDATEGLYVYKSTGWIFVI
jgi:hypothetical protein